MKNKLNKIYTYTVFYQKDSEGGYVVFVPALPGCHTQGETLKEAEENAKEAIELYLETLVEFREPILEEAQSYQSKVSVPVLIPA